MSIWPVTLYLIRVTVVFLRIYESISVSLPRPIFRSDIVTSNKGYVPALFRTNKVAACALYSP
ncbi:MAG: hypothetical protein QOI07_447 [Verrucomicrobiota bacterium]